MKIVVFIVATVVGLVALVGLAGSLLPRHHVAARSAHFHASPDSLWQTLTDFARLPTWAPEVMKVERLPDRNGHPVWRQTGARWSAPMEVVELQPTHRFTVRIVDPKLPFGGAWTYEIAAAPGGTAVTITENGDIRNPVMRFLSRFVFGQTSTLDGVLRALGKKHGETVTPGPGIAAQ